MNPPKDRAGARARSIGPLYMPAPFHVCASCGGRPVLAVEFRGLSMKFCRDCVAEMKRIADLEGQAR
jgi:hypothetical protein